MVTTQTDKIFNRLNEYFFKIIITYALVLKTKSNNNLKKKKEMLQKYNSSNCEVVLYEVNEYILNKIIYL